MKTRINTDKYLGRLLVLFLLATFGICSSTAHAEETANPTSEDTAATKAPTTPIELLKNLKYAIDNNLFANNDVIMNDEKLWQLFGGKQFLRGYPIDPSNVDVALTFFPSSIDKATLDPKVPMNEHLRIVIERIEILHKVSIVLNYTLGLDLRRPDIESVFGQNWKNARPHFDVTSSCLRGANCPKPVHYQEVEYTMDTPDLDKAVATVTYDAAGKVANITINLQEKKP